MTRKSTTLRYEVFTLGSRSRVGPWESLHQLKAAAEDYVNTNHLSERVVNVSEAIYAWAQGTSGVTRAFVTVWFCYPSSEENPARKDAFQGDGE